MYGYAEKHFYGKYATPGDRQTGQHHIVLIKIHLSSTRESNHIPAV